MNNLNIKIDNNFFKSENRDDFFVDEKRKKIWAIEIDLYKKFEEICNKYDIKYCVFAGTLLGAVRHKGFIPWDDDFDVCLDRENYNKLLCHVDEFTHPYFLQYALNDRKFFFGYARLRNSETTGIIKWDKSVDYNNGIYIDIFVLDGYIYNEFLLKIQIKFRNFIQRLLCNYYYSFDHCLKDNFKKYIVSKFSCLFSYDAIFNLYNMVISIFNNNTDRIGLMTHDFKFLTKYWIYKKDTENIYNSQFEFTCVKIPTNYDNILKRIYGKYTNFPPTADRGKWHENIIIFDPDMSYIKYLNINSNVQYND